MPSSGNNNGVLYGLGINISGDGIGADNQLDTDGYLLIGNSIGYAQGAPLTSTDGTITITNGPGTIDLSASGLGVVWANIGASQALEVNHGYICNAGAAISLSLPSSAAVGTIIEIVLNGSTSWTITQGAGQQIRLGNVQTTAGVGGSIGGSTQGDWIQLVCDTSGSHWMANAKSGNFTVA